MRYKNYKFLLLIFIIGFSCIFLPPNQEINNKKINDRYSEKNNLKTSDQSLILNFNTPEQNHTIVSIFYNYTIIITIVKPEPVFDYGVPNITIYENETIPIVNWTPMNRIGSSDSWNYTIDPINYVNENYTLKIRALDYIGFGYNQTEIYILNNPPDIAFINLSPLDKIHRINEPYFNINASIIDPEGDPILTAVVMIMDINDTVILGWSIMENLYGDYYNYTFDPINYDLGYYTIWIGVMDEKTPNYENVLVIIYEIASTITLLSPTETELNVNDEYLIECDISNDFDIISVEWVLTKEIGNGWNGLDYNDSNEHWEGILNTTGYGIGDFYLVINATDKLGISFSTIANFTLIYQTLPSINILNPNKTEFYLNKRYSIKCSISNDFEIISVNWAITNELGNYDWNTFIYNTSSGYWEDTFFGFDYGLGDYYLVINVTDEFGISFSTILPITFLEDSNNGNGDNLLNYLLWILFIVITLGSFFLIFLTKKKFSKKDITSELLKKKKKKTVKGSLLNTPEKFKGFVDIVDLLIKDGLIANEEGEYKKAIKYWSMSIKQLQKIKKKANLFPQLLIDVDDQINFLKINIQNAWDKEKSRIVDYFLNITSIHAVLIIHIERCCCLSKINYHLGQNIDETLFSAFLSAILGFKTEIGNKMGLSQKDKKINVLSFNNFNITLLDGAFLRLGIVSDDILEGLIIEKAFRVIDKYENIHYETLKYFNGGLAPYRDFPQFIDDEFDLSLNRKSTIDIDNFVKSRSPTPIKLVLRRLLNSKEIFYPAKLWDILMRDAKLSKEDAIYHTYEIFQEKVLHPIEDLPKSEDKLYPTEEDKEII